MPSFDHVPPAAVLTIIGRSFATPTPGHSGRILETMFPKHSDVKANETSPASKRKPTIYLTRTALDVSVICGSSRQRIIKLARKRLSCHREDLKGSVGMLRTTTFTIFLSRHSVQLDCIRQPALQLETENLAERGQYQR